MRMLEIDLPSALPFKKLGVLEPKLLNVESLGGFVLRADRGLSFANGLGGTPLPRVSPRGGCGNELILTHFRSVFPVPLTPSFGCGSADVGRDQYDRHRISACSCWVGCRDGGNWASSHRRDPWLCGSSLAVAEKDRTDTKPWSASPSSSGRNRSAS